MLWSWTDTEVQWVEEETQWDDTIPGALLNAAVPKIQAAIGCSGLHATFPKMLSMVMGADDLNHGRVFAELPSIEALTRERVYGNLDAALPRVVSAVAATKDTYLEDVLPAITSEVRSGALCNAVLQALEVIMTSDVGRTGSVNAIISAVTASVAGKVEVLGDIDVVLPELQSYISGLVGKVIAGSATLPAVQGDIDSYNDLLGDIEETLPGITSYLAGYVEREVCPPLRYPDLPDCLGDIVTMLPEVVASVAG